MTSEEAAMSVVDALEALLRFRRNVSGDQY
jgi:hypothetical protein